ncbi:ComEA family DNA-binding protein [Nocardioides zeae]|uniref:ComEA family DNA-binding protein n=1 Tax=Nocardioides imazamoxiresistens TaxID=3231893 RepID=A0ABU3Q113_9ACTN|nr:ComEA family DNA-binding protein [Nocardioides zeae]MDT9595198.1 ComEA family DNA-binding protein [Nocardioides zeae]
MPVRDPSTDVDVLRARLEENTRIRDDGWHRQVLARAGGTQQTSGPDEPVGMDTGDGPHDVAGPALPRPGRHARPGSRVGAGAGIRAGLPLPGGARLALGPAQVAVVALVAALALALTGWWLVRSQAAERPVVPVSTAATGTSLGASATDGGASSAAPAPGGADAAPDAGPDAGPVGGSDGAAAEVVVHVDGEVARPGIVVLPVGSRVADAVEAAGGALPDVDLVGVNLARLLVDGEQVLVGVDALPAPAGPSGGQPGPAGGASPGGAGGSGAAGGQVNLNTADLAALDTLPGVGPVTAQAILDWRTENGGFTSVDELVEVDGIGEATLARIAPHATV